MLPLAVIANPAIQASNNPKGSKRGKHYRASLESLQRDRLTSSSLDSIIVRQPRNLESRAGVTSAGSPSECYSEQGTDSLYAQSKTRSTSRSKQRLKTKTISGLKRKKRSKTKAKSGNSAITSNSTNSGSLSISPSSPPFSPTSPQFSLVRDQNASSSTNFAVRGSAFSNGGAIAAKSFHTSASKSSPSRAVQAKHVPIDVSPYLYLNKSTPFAASDCPVQPTYAPSFVAAADITKTSDGSTAATCNDTEVGNSVCSVPDFPLPSLTGLSCSTKPKPKHVEIITQDSTTQVLGLSQTSLGNISRGTAPSRANTPHLLEVTASTGLLPPGMAHNYQNGDDAFAIQGLRNTPSLEQQQYQHQAYMNPSQYDHHAQGTQHSQNHQHPDRQNGTLHSNHVHTNGNHSGTSQQYAREESLHRDGPTSATQTPASVASSAGTPSLGLQTAGVGRTSTSATSTLSGLVCNVHRTTGREPHALVGASTTILGDKLYVFGGRRLSRSRPFLTSDLYELDLIRRHWTKLETRGDIPAPRYFHSVCTLGDTKLVCYGGMTPQAAALSQHVASQQAKSNERNGNHNGSISEQQLAVMSDVHIYDTLTRTWMHIPSQDAPQGRYAHCAAILPSSGVFSSPDAPLSAIHHNPSSPHPNRGTIGVALDGNGGAEMIIVGGQDKENHYIEQISVFNLRSLRWTATNKLEKSCGAYRSVVTPLTTMSASDIGTAVEGTDNPTHRETDNPHQNEAHDKLGYEPNSSLLIYSNYNFLQVKLELQVRLPDGTLVDKPMQSQQSPPGLRFPNGGVIANHFVVSGTFLTPSEQEYAMWALDLRTLSWSRIDAGGSIFRHGSWNRGLLWNRRNTFIVLGNRKRRLVEDYHHRRINFSNICTVELEAFGLYDNPRRREPTSGYVSSSCAAVPTILSPVTTSPIPPPPSKALPQTPVSADPARSAGGRQLNRVAQELGEFALQNRELCDMDFLAIDGKRISVNSRLIAQRWGPYFTHLMHEGAAAAAAAAAATGQLDGAGSATDTATLRPSAASQASRNSSVTITQSVKTAFSVATTVTNNVYDVHRPNGDFEHAAKPGSSGSGRGAVTTAKDDPTSPYVLHPSARPRTLYLPHTYLTLRALVTYLYTSTLPSSSFSIPSKLHRDLVSSRATSASAAGSPLESQQCSPQVLCSLLQIARPYRIDGLLEAVVERLHAVLDGRNTAAIFNAAAMAAGGGDGVGFYSVFETGPDGRDGGVNGFGMADLATLTAHAHLESSNGHKSSNNLRGPIKIDTSVSREDAAGDGDRSAGGFTTSSSIAQSNYPPSEPGSSSASAVSGLSGSGTLEGDDIHRSGHGRAGVADAVDEEIWSGELSAVVGLQKRGLRGLMEGRRLRERGGSAGGGSGIGVNGMNDGSSTGGQGEGGSVVGVAVGVGLGIA